VSDSRLAAAIDKYVYITLHQRFVPQILLKYSQMEEVDCVDEIKHPLIREAFGFILILAYYIALPPLFAKNSLIALGRHSLSRCHLSPRAQEKRLVTQKTG
jgi:hypothetical protein